MDPSNKYYDAWYTSFEFMVFCASVLMSPFMFLKTIEKLKYVSFIAILAICTFTILCVYNFAHIFATGDGPEIPLFPKDFKFFKAMGSLPTIMLAMAY
jgi:amino acid permease